MPRTSLLLVVPLLALAIPARALAQLPPFPGRTPGTDLTPALPVSYEGSGLLWHPVLRKLFAVSDDGRITRMEASGAMSTTASSAGDLEAITLADPTTDFVYVGVENPDSIKEVRISTGATTRVFDLTPWMTGPSNEGLEGLTFVPDPLDPEGGLFFAGEQADGKIYKFRLPIKTSATSTTVTFLGSSQPVAGRIDIRELSFDRDTGNLWCIWFTPSVRIGQLTSTGTFVTEWAMVTAKPEGIAVKGCELFVIQDNGAGGASNLQRFDAFPSASACPSLATDTARASVAAGATAKFTLHSSAPLPANAIYLLLGSASGTAPGFVAGGVPVPLNPDAYFSITANQANSPPFVTTLGTFAADGFASSSLALPPALPAVLVGLTLNHAWIGVHPVTNAVKAASGAVSLTFVP